MTVPSVCRGGVAVARCASLTVATAHAADTAEAKSREPIGPGPVIRGLVRPRTDDNVVLSGTSRPAAIRTIAPPPTVSARGPAVMKPSMYDAWTSYDAPPCPPGGRLEPARSEERTFERKSMEISTPPTARSATCSRPRTAPSPRYGPPQLQRRPTGQPDAPATIVTEAGDAVIESRRTDGANQAATRPGAKASPTPTPGRTEQAVHRTVLQPVGQSFSVPHWQR